MGLFRAIQKRRRAGAVLRPGLAKLGAMLRRASLSSSYTSKAVHACALDSA